jgi:1-acyl-sn-glycerol-3-phosphate acyltransferase
LKNFELITHGAMRLIAHMLSPGLRLEVSGLDHVPEHGPAILVARHYHHLYDGIALQRAIPRRIHIIVTLDWAETSFTRFAMEKLIRAARWPIVLRAEALARQGRGQTRPRFTAADLLRYQRRAIQDSIALLEQDQLVVIFPEAYPNVDPHYTPKIGAQEMLPFKAGFAAIAGAAEKRLKQVIPLIPVGLSYSGGKRRVVYLNCGEPLSARDFISREALIGKLEQDVAMLSNSGGST